MLARERHNNQPEFTYLEQYHLISKHGGMVVMWDALSMKTSHLHKSGQSWSPSLHSSQRALSPISQPHLQAPAMMGHFLTRGLELNYV